MILNSNRRRRYYLVLALGNQIAKGWKALKKIKEIDNMIKTKDIWRPIVGTLALQPLALCWAYFYNINYLENLGLFTIISTLYLIPVYYFYEQNFPEAIING